MSSKRGPNGQAIISAIHDFRLLPQWLIDKIISLAGIGLKQCIDLMNSTSCDGILSVDV